MGREFELKYRLDEKSFGEICARFGPFTSISMETVYFDTPSGSLSALRWTLRCRKENGKSICTLKTPGINGGRGEWETECPRVEDAVEPLILLGAPEELKALTREGVRPTCGAKFTRLAAQIEYEGSEIELALDRGVLLGGGKEEALLELEAELKQGSEETAKAFAVALARQYGLSEEPLSKFARARQLA